MCKILQGCIQGARDFKLRPENCAPLGYCSVTVVVIPYHCSLRKSPRERRSESRAKQHVRRQAEWRAKFVFLISIPDWISQPQVVAVVVPGKYHRIVPYEHGTTIARAGVDPACAGKRTQISAPSRP
jgi:hypothetical protein